MIATHSPARRRVTAKPPAARPDRGTPGLAGKLDALAAAYDPERILAWIEAKARADFDAAGGRLNHRSGNVARRYCVPKTAKPRARFAARALAELDILRASTDPAWRMAAAMRAVLLAFGHELDAGGRNLRGGDRGASIAKQIRRGDRSAEALRRMVERTMRREQCSVTRARRLVAEETGDSYSTVLRHTKPPKPAN